MTNTQDNNLKSLLYNQKSLKKILIKQNLEDNNPLTFLNKKKVKDFKSVANLENE